jgi:hypothetical protein
MKERIIINIKYINMIGKKYTCIIFSILGAIAIFFPINEYIENMIYKIVAIIIIIAAMYVSAIISTFLQKKKEILSKNGKKVIVEYGDIFSKKYYSKILTIPVNRCFDTIVDNDLISLDKLHGKVMNEIIKSSENEAININLIIQTKLENQNLEYELLERENKSKGNLKRYPVGTIAEYKALGNIYYFLGLSYFDKQLHAQYNERDQLLAIQKLLEYHNIHGNGRDLVIPIIGGGNTGTNKKEKLILDMIIELIKFNENLINSNIYIIVRENTKKEVSILDL